MNNLNQNSSKWALEALDISKLYKQGSHTIEVLKKVDFKIASGEFISIVGHSGAGKSTLLQILGGLEQPTEGIVNITGTDISTLSVDERSIHRRKNVGFIFQFHHLLPAFSAIENVMMPLRINGVSDRDAFAPAQELLHSLGVGHRLNNKPSELSGGEQQRVAVARALVTSPSVILADEPTGNLDRQTGKKLEEDLIAFARDRQAAVIVVTHDEAWASRADRVVKLADGSISKS